MSNAGKEPGDGKSPPCEPAELLSQEPGGEPGHCGVREQPHGTKRGREDEPGARTEGGANATGARCTGEQPRQQGGEEEEGEEEEEEEEEEEGDEWAMLAGADGAEFSASRDRENDGFLEDFAKELDGDSSSSSGEGEGEEGQEQIVVDGVKREREGERQKEEDDEQVARTLQEEEWRRNLPPLPGEFAARTPVGPSSGGAGGARVSSVFSSESGSSSSSIFDVPRSGGGSSSLYVSGLCCGVGGVASRSGGGGGTFCGEIGAGSGLRSFCRGTSGQGSGEHDSDGERSPPAAVLGGDGACTSGLLRREGESSVAGGGRPSRGKGKQRAATLAAWPPGGLGEGEGLRINDLPDEIVDNIASFSLLPRCVSKRIERYRVKVVRERVIGALESSAKLPAPKAQEVEDAIFALCGNSVPKAYKNKAREMSFNLRVGKNDPLRERLLTGSLLPSELVRMSSNELAPLSVRRERERLARKRIQEVTSSRDSPFHTVTDRFTCQECGHERTQYRTWRRKAVVDRVRVIVQCLQCRHSWEL